MYLFPGIFVDSKSAIKNGYLHGYFSGMSPYRVVKGDLGQALCIMQCRSGHFGKVILILQQCCNETDLVGMIWVSGITMQSSLSSTQNSMMEEMSSVDSLMWECWETHVVGSFQFIV